ncbi:hypothetical protein GDO78_020006 [Eleutherodactylus coqui]|uniref:Uncharacterized protein n=1 Tax=Eleutherodactylus coqui TaxID=57060 RepID=A0A8J6B9D2_ELECQ|nr:hypothetical protein GDO78_020006 [Eleutherodactylus coqui]
MVRMDRIEEVRPHSPTTPALVLYSPSLSSGMKRSQAFFTTSSSSGGLLRRTWMTRRSWRGRWSPGGHTVPFSAEALQERLAPVSSSISSFIS